MNRIFNTIFRLFLAVFPVIVSAVAHAEEPPRERIVITPFKVNSEKDVLFLRDGIADMLSSRLGGDKVVVIDREETARILSKFPVAINEAAAVEIGSLLQARHIIYGSITVFGESVSIDARVIDAAGEMQPLSFYAQTSGMGAVIPKINDFAAEINQKVFGRQAVVSASQPEETRKATGSLPADDIHAHPEKLLQVSRKQEQNDKTKKPITVGQQDNVTAAVAPNPLFTTAQEQDQIQKYWKSRNFNRLINGIAIGDIDGDGRNEIVLTESNTMHIYQFENNRMVKTRKVIKGKRKYNVGIDIADINGNGKPEVFLTQLNALQNRISSTVYEFDGATLTPILEKRPWFYRVSGGSGNPPILLAQKKERDDAFTAAVFSMVWNGSDYAPFKRVIVKKKTNALGSAFGNLLNQDGKNAVAFSAQESIQLFGVSGKKVIYTAENEYGGSYREFSLPVTDPMSGKESQYLPARLMVVDIDGNGSNELITIRNYDIGHKKMKIQRKFTKGQLVCLKWDGISLNETWSTPKLAGYISDFAIADLDGDGRKELIAVLVIKSGRLVGRKPVSCIIAYPIG